ncbi:MAG: hypothetical protein WCR42_07225 [bacterium]
MCIKTATMLCVILLFAISMPTFSQIKAVKISKSQIPTEIKYSSIPICSYKWTDKLGTNYLICSMSKEYAPPEAIEARKHYQITKYDDYIDTMYDSYEADFINRELYAARYCVSNGKVNVVWQLEDEVHQCPADMTLKFLGKPQITDLNGDNTAEVWFLYTLGCRSDVSPVDMKLIMYDGKNKYAIRGTRILQYEGQTEFDGGDKKMDEAFYKLSDNYQKYAWKLWNKFKTEHLE